MRYNLEFISALEATIVPEGFVDRVQIVCVGRPTQ
jgi:hypothetical protein